MDEMEAGLQVKTPRKEQQQHKQGKERLDDGIDGLTLLISSFLTFGAIGV
jgi:hypothetical protein